MTSPSSDDFNARTARREPTFQLSDPQPDPFPQGQAPVRRIDAYTQTPPPMTRIELLLAAFEGVITRIQQAGDLFERGERTKADLTLCRAQRIILELYSGIDLRYGEIPENMKKLYLYVLGCIGMGRELDLRGAVSILDSIQSGLRSIHDKAIEMERSGAISPARNEACLLQNIVA